MGLIIRIECSAQIIEPACVNSEFLFKGHAKNDFVTPAVNQKHAFLLTKEGCALAEHIVAPLISAEKYCLCQLKPAGTDAVPSMIVFAL